MAGLLIRMAIVAVGLWLGTKIVPGMEIRSDGDLIAAALLLGLVNAFVRPIIVILTLPITVLTLGIFLLVINALMVMLVGAILPGLTVSGFGSALLASIVVSLTSWVASWYVGPRGRTEVIVVDGRR